MLRDPVIELLRRSVTPELYREVRGLWQEHSKAEDRRDIPGLLATLTDDCVYELFPGGKRWTSHAGAEQFYTQLLTAFPDVKFRLTDIVIGPQGVCEEADVTATHVADWLDYPASGRSVEFKVVIFFPWDLERKRFRGERIYLDLREVRGQRLGSES
ncbi:MAG TPA: ester cyclase [Pirellulales bacterium]|nr:ester cyclase [Pirellulales bacterium]